jgi:casein kinase II subunit beta
MYHFETLTEVTLGRPQSGRSARFDCGTYRNQSPFVLTYVASHNWLSLVQSTFFEDSFNTYGLPIAAADYQLALQVIRGEPLDSPPPPDANRLAETAYGYLHARYIFTANGLKAMRRKFEAGVFGQCPRFRCDCQQLLPIGLASDMGRGTAKVFCPRCRDVYDAETDLDGAAFGPSFPHFFLQMNRDIKFPHRAQQMRFDICGIQIEPTARLCPRRIIREKLDASGSTQCRSAQARGQPRVVPAAPLIHLRLRAAHKPRFAAVPCPDCARVDIAAVRQREHDGRV